MGGKEETGRQNAGHARLAHDYRYNLVNELLKLCDLALTLLKNKLMPEVLPGETKVIYLMMMGDYNRYKAEFVSAQDRKDIAIEAQSAYSEAMEEATEHLLETHPLRLSLALNFAIFQRSMLANDEEAIVTATRAYNAAVARLEVMPTE